MRTNQRLRLFLKLHGFQQKNVAHAVGMKHKSFNAMLNGHAELKADTLEAVCRFIGVPPEKFFAFKPQEYGINPDTPAAHGDVG